MHWFLRRKDCSLKLADALGLEYTVLSTAGTGLAANAVELTTACMQVARLTQELDIDLWVSKYGAASLGAKLSRSRSLSFNDDDADVVPFVAATSYPVSDAALVTNVTRMGRYETKAVRFPGYFELCYLHPDRFVPDRSIFQQLGLDDGSKYAIIRLSGLSAHHDRGVTGASDDLVREVCAEIKGHVRPFITSERPLPSDLEPYRCKVPVHRMHHALAFAEFYLGDSQTMTSEAAVLGTPTFRINDFVGRLSYLDDLENYGLSFGFLPGQEEQLFETFREIIGMENRVKEFQKRRRRMLGDKIDPTPWFSRAVQLCLAGAGPRELRARLQTEEEFT